MAKKNGRPKSNRCVGNSGDVPGAIHSAVNDVRQPLCTDWKMALGRFSDELRHVYGDRLRGVFLYGSRARGDATPESDIDTLVLLRPCQDFWAELKRISPVASRVSLDHDVVISAMPIDADRFGDDERPVIVNARREGRMITRSGSGVEPREGPAKSEERSDDHGRR